MDEQKVKGILRSMSMAGPDDYSWDDIVERTSQAICQLDEHVCPECKGNGWSARSVRACPTCQGTGKTKS